VIIVVVVLLVIAVVLLIVWRIRRKVRQVLRCIAYVLYSFACDCMCVLLPAARIMAARRRSRLWWRSNYSDAGSRCCRHALRQRRRCRAATAQLVGILVLRQALDDDGREHELRRTVGRCESADCLHEMACFRVKVNCIAGERETCISRVARARVIAKSQHDLRFVVGFERRLRVQSDFSNQVRLSRGL
jgi:hypothetical protein